MGDYARWVWRKAEPTSLARFVNVGCAAGVLPQITLPDGRSVHDAVKAGDREAVARALYNAVATLQLDYDIESYTADGQHSQVVRSPPEIRDRGRATCLDLALLFAGLALDLNLRPIVILPEGHALIAIVNIDFALEIDPTTEVATLLEWMNPEAQTLIPIECTGATTGEGLSFDFETAVQRGREVIERRPFLFAIDPYRLQRDQGLEPASCEARPNRWFLPVGAAAAALVLGTAWWLWPEPAPVFSTGVEGIVVPEISGAPGVGAWLAEGLQAAADSNRTLVDVDACGQVVRLEVFGPKEADRLDLADPDNPSNTDVLLTGTVDPAGQSSRDLFVTVGIEPISATLTESSDPVLLTLGSSPAAVDLDRDPLVIYPELTVLPAVVLGLRQLELASDQGLADADCLFDLADERLERSTANRVQRYRASVAVLAANGHILAASSLPEEQERQRLDRARALLDRAEAHVTSDADLAVIRANGLAIAVMEVITDQGLLASGVDQSEVDTLLDAMDEAALLVADGSGPAYLALQSMSAKLLLAAAPREGNLADVDPTLVERALAQTDDALARADELSGPQARRQLAEVHEVRGIARMLTSDWPAAILEFEEAAARAAGALHYEYLVNAALARISRCQDDDPEVIEEIIGDARRWLDSQDSAALGERVDAIAALADRECP
jgi:hypothetical protein